MKTFLCVVPDNDGERQGVFLKAIWSGTDAKICFIQQNTSDTITAQTCSWSKPKLFTSAKGECVALRKMSNTATLPQLPHTADCFFQMPDFHVFVEGNVWAFDTSLWHEVLGLHVDRKSLYRAPKEFSWRPVALCHYSCLRGKASSGTTTMQRDMP